MLKNGSSESFFRNNSVLQQKRIKALPCLSLSYNLFAKYLFLVVTENWTSCHQPRGNKPSLAYLSQHN
jgi:hypothetical protein